MDNLGGGKSCSNGGCGGLSSLARMFNYHPVNLLLDQLGIAEDYRDRPPPMRIAQGLANKMSVKDLTEMFNAHPINQLMDALGIGTEDRNRPPPVRLMNTAYRSMEPRTQEMSRQHYARMNAQNNPYLMG